MKKLSLVLSMLVLGLAGNAFAAGDDPFDTGGLPTVTCQEQFGTGTNYTTYLVLLGNTGLVVDAPVNDPFDDVCVYFPNSPECKNRPTQPSKPSKAAVRLFLNVEKISATARGALATGTVSTRGAYAAAGRFQLNLESADQGGWVAKLATSAGVRFFNCRVGNGGLVLQ